MVLVEKTFTYDPEDNTGGDAAGVGGGGASESFNEVDTETYLSLIHI